MTAAQPATEPLPLGVRLVGLAFRRVPGLSVAAMSPERLIRLQTRPLPERGPGAVAVGLALGRRQRGVRVGTAYAGRTPLRVYTPVRPRPGAPIVLSLHGGGFALGSARQADWMASRVARDLDAVVVAPDYRLAPDHPFPAAVEDCHQALRWTREHAARLGADPDRLGVLGESAGGNLAAVVCLLAVADGGPPIRHQALLYPATDLTEGVMTTASYAEHAQAPILSAASLRWFRDTYLGPDGDPTDWRCSPVRAPSMTGLPPTLLVLAGHDPLHDTGAAYGRALTAAGVEVDVREYPAMPHGFVGFPTLARDASAAMRAVVAAQRAVL